MTRTPAQDARNVKLGRLPELARVLRSVFVAEKRGVMSLDNVLDKMSHSYPHQMSTGEQSGNVTSEVW
jgi:chromatin licensing and DNA replication factor 1